MAQNLMVWLIERRVVLEERAVQLRKQLADTEAEVPPCSRAYVRTMSAWSSSLPPAPCPAGSTSARCK
jgi:hypothetical protein